MSFKMTWLENLSAMELNQALVLSYFIRDLDSPTRLVLRASLTPKDADSTASIDSVTTIWPMAREFEKEISDLFGVVFNGNQIAGRYVLPEDWIGYPLRKSYVFPTSFYGVSHFKPVGHSIPDEYGSDFSPPVETGMGAAFGVEP
ncbi:MAG: NADH-quinone oxidoreductase subunit C [Bdellovibrionales bacterium]|nr:NADH-quinone oxidoreductase subunit C [Bdellovibrionales bacterium]